MQQEINRMKLKALDDFNRAFNAQIEARETLINSGANPELLKTFEDLTTMAAELTAILDNLREQEQLLKYVQTLNTRHNIK